MTLLSYVLPVHYSVWVRSKSARVRVLKMVKYINSGVNDPDMGPHTI